MTWPFPRLRFRLRTGVWCSHRTYRFGSWMDHVDAEFAQAVAGPPGEQRYEFQSWLDAEFPRDLGMDDGTIVDGMRKLYRCRRCGWATFHPDGHDRSAWLDKSIVAFFLGLVSLSLWGLGNSVVGGIVLGTDQVPSDWVPWWLAGFAAFFTAGALVGWWLMGRRS